MASKIFFFFHFLMKSVSISLHQLSFRSPLPVQKRLDDIDLYLNIYSHKGWDCNHFHQKLRLDSKYKWFFSFTDFLFILKLPLTGRTTSLTPNSFWIDFEAFYFSYRYPDPASGSTWFFWMWEHLLFLFFYFYSHSFTFSSD